MIRPLIALAVFLSIPAAAVECPSTIYYKNGAYLKSGSTFYYPNGGYLRSGSSVYYPNGAYLKSGSSLYYPNGAYLKSGSSLYYPNGAYLKSGSSVYYSNGAYLQSGSSLYYKNGNYARSGSSLYREDGTRTDFPVTLEERIGDFGRLLAFVQKSGERIELDLAALVSTELATVGLDRAPVEAEGEIPLSVELRTGHPNEKVRLRIANGEVQCELAGAEMPGTPADFSLTSKHAEVSVRVFDSRNAERVKKALLDALLSLEQARPAR